MLSKPHLKVSKEFNFEIIIQDFLKKRFVSSESVCEQ